MLQLIIFLIKNHRKDHEMKKSAKGFLAFLNLIGFLATVAVNALATLLPINGKGTGELSDQYPIHTEFPEQKKQ